jgi:hypothetical protein
MRGLSHVPLATATSDQCPATSPPFVSLSLPNRVTGNTIRTVPMPPFPRSSDILPAMIRAFTSFILGCVIAGCTPTSTPNAGASGGAPSYGGSTAVLSGGTGGTSALGGAGGTSVLGGAGGGSSAGGTAGGTGGTTCPSDMPSPYGAEPCSSEGTICEYSAPLVCPVGCSGGDYHAVQCSQGIWVDFRHSAGVPTCRCSPLNFPTGMQGTWLLGWAGDMNHYSWIRLSALSDVTTDPSTPGDGTIEILAGQDAIVVNDPFWPCSGQGRWFITQRPETFELWLPSTCSSGATEVYTVTSRESAIPSFLPGCLLHITLGRDSGAPLEACKYPDSQCDATMATCRPIR